jgi:hypothetical protein
MAGSDPLTDNTFVRIGVPEMYATLQRVAEGNQRLEAKVDTALSIQTLRTEQLSKEITRMQAQMAEMQAQIDEIDKRPVVTPKALLTTVTVMGIIVAIITSLVGLFVKVG